MNSSALTKICVSFRKDIQYASNKEKNFPILALVAYRLQHCWLILSAIVKKNS